MKTIKVIKIIENKHDFEEIQPYSIHSFEMGKAEAILHVPQDGINVYYVVPLTNQEEMQNCYDFLKTFNVGLYDSFYSCCKFNFFNYSISTSLELLKIKKILDGMKTNVTAFQVDCCLWNSIGILEREYKEAIASDTLAPFVEMAVARINDELEEKKGSKRKAVTSC